MPVERAGYTVTMFVVDISASMGNIREVEVDNPDGTTRVIEMTNLQWALQYVKLKIQEMIYNGRKTDQCGVIVVGTEETRNIVNEEHKDYYRNIIEYIPIAQPDASTIAKVDALRPSTTAGDAFDALVVAAAVQQRYLNTKKTWTRKIILVTDGESPMELTDTEGTSDKLKEFGTKVTIVGVDFDDEEYGYEEPNKSPIKQANETFFRNTFIPSLPSDCAYMGTCALALQETSAPEIRVVKSMLMATVLRIGDLDARSDEAIELPIKTCKCTSVARAKSWKKYTLRKKLDADGQEIEEEEEIDGDKKAIYAPLKLRTEFLIDRNPSDEDKDGDVKMKTEDEDVKMETEDNDETLLKATKLEQIEKEDLVKGFKYGTTYVPCPDGQFSRLPTRKGIDICGFFRSANFRRELAMGEIQYVWADPNIPSDQVALSSIVQAMKQREVMAIARWVTKDGMDPKMGVLSPVIFDNVDCLIWIPMPFADDVRKYPFASLDILVNKKGEVLKEHPYLPTQEQLDAMDRFVDAMDLEDCGPKDEEGNRTPWFANNDAWNPSVHRVKQAMFHAAIVEDVTEYPLPPPHPETIKYFEPPTRALKRARGAIEECKSVFNVKEVVKVTKSKKDNHSLAQDDDDDMLLLDLKKPVAPVISQMDVAEAGPSSSTQAKVSLKVEDEDSVTEDEDEEELLLNDKKPSQPTHRGGPPLPTPARSLSPQVDPGREPGRIIGSTHPLKDFKQNIAQGDVVTKAVQDLSAVIAEIVMKPFASRRSDEMLDCMFTLRQTCLEEDEIDAWNTFIRDLKKKCQSTPGNQGFWGKVQEHGRDLSLISKQEAKRQGGDSEVTENEAGEFTS